LDLFKVSQINRRILDSFGSDFCNFEEDRIPLRLLFNDDDGINVDPKIVNETMDSLAHSMDILSDIPSPNLQDINESSQSTPLPEGNVYCFYTVDYQRVICPYFLGYR
jgi:hypothetical protein